MLRGAYRVGKVVYNLEGYDYTNNFQFYLTCDKYAKKYIDKGIRYRDDVAEEDIYIPAHSLWDKLYIQVTENKVNVAKYEEPGRHYNELSKQFFTVLGSIMTVCRTQCNESRMVGYTEAFGMPNDPEAVKGYLIEGIIPPNKARKTVYTAYVERKWGSIQSIHMGDDTTDYELLLEEDGDNSMVLTRAGQTKHLHQLPFDISRVFPSIKPKISFEEKIAKSRGLLENLLTWDEIQERHPDRNYQWLHKQNYKVVTDREEMKQICKKIMAHDGIVAFDTETTGLNFTFEGMSGQGDKLVGMVFSINEGEAWYFPVRHNAFDNICNEANEFDTITKYFKPILEEKDILCHNASFDMKVMFRYDIRLNLKEDTMVLLAQTLALKHSEYPTSLKGATRQFLERDSYELEDLVANGKWIYNFADLPKDYVHYYACADTDNTLTLYNWFKANRILDKYDAYSIYYKVELPFTSVIAYSEYFGMMVDMDKSEELDKELHETVAKEEQEIYKLAGKQFPINSSQELSKVLFEEMGCPPQGYTDTGAYSTNKKALAKLAALVDENGEPRYPITTHLKKYKEAQKLISGFTNLLNGKANEKGKENKNNISPSGVISSRVRPFLETGRVSVNNPNYQSFSDTVKRYIIPRNGYYMIDADYSSVEYRITASMSGQKELIDAFFDPDTDYHKLKASLMFQIPYEDVAPELRRMAKQFNFGIPYGMGYKSLAELLFGKSDPEAVSKAMNLYELYFQGQDNVRAFFENGRAEGWVNGRSRTYFGGYRYYDVRKKRRDKIEKESGNHKIQGTAANIYKMAMSDLYRKICERGWWGKVLISGFIHDECLLEASCDINPAIVMAELRDSMMIDIEGWCPLYTGMGCGANWDDAKHIEIPTQLQEEMFSKYGETGFPWWKGDPQELYDNMKQFIYDYKRDRVLKYLDNPENHGTVLPLVENDLAHEVLGAVHDGKYTNGVVDKDQPADHDILVNLLNFCKMFGREDLFEKAELKPKEKAEVKADDSTIDFSVVKPLLFGEFTEEQQRAYLTEAVKSYGLYRIPKEDKVYVLTDNRQFLGVVKRDFKLKDGDFEVWLVSENWDGPKKSKYKMNASDYLDLQQAYMNLMK